jgi:hypothetical protein
MTPLSIRIHCNVIGAKLSEEDIALDEAAEEAAVLQPHTPEISAEDSMEVSSDEGTYTAYKQHCKHESLLKLLLVVLMHVVRSIVRMLTSQNTTLFFCFIGVTSTV